MKKDEKKFRKDVDSLMKSW